MAKVKWRWSVAGFAELRNHPTLVSAMEGAARNAAAGTNLDVEVNVWPHEGRRAGPRTSVQIWARHPRARAVVNKRPETLTSTLGRARL